MNHSHQDQCIKSTGPSHCSNELDACIERAFQEYPNKQDIQGFFPFVRQYHPSISRKRVTDYIRKKRI
jgi:hypothetical protein